MTEFDQVVWEMVSENGTTGTYRKVVPGVYSPSTGVTTTNTDISVKCYIADLTLQSNGFSVKYGTSILAGDKEAHFIPPIKNGGAALTIDPVNDKFILAGVTYAIVTFKEVNLTGNNPILYSLYLRR